MTETLIVENKTGEVAKVIGIDCSVLDNIIKDKIGQFEALRNSKLNQIKKIQSEITRINDVIEILEEVKNEYHGQTKPPAEDGLKKAYLEDRANIYDHKPQYSEKL